MKEDFNNNTSDFRIQIPNESCIVRCTFYVVAMGRDVVFYIGFSNLYNGSGDFITSVEVTQPVQAQEEPQAEPQDQPIEEPSTSQVVTIQATTTTPTTTTSVSTSQSSTITTQNTTQTTTSITTDTTTTTTEVTTTQTTIETTSQEVIGIVMFDENGNEIKELYASNDTPIEEITPSQSNSHTRVVVIVVGAVALVVVIAVTLLRKKRS
jgi:cobalamin biosynthesis Mg chelatase CobN